jgi:diguanylate cyclase
VEKDVVDWSKLPDVIAVGLLFWAFASVTRRFHTSASRHWFAGWCCIILHFSLQFLAPLPGAWGTGMGVGSLLALMAAALFFMGASAPVPHRHVRYFMLALMMTFFSLSTCLLIFQAPGWAINLSEAALCLTPLAMTVFYPLWSNPVLRWTMSLLHLGLWPVLWIAQHRPDGVDLSLNAMLFLLYISCAIHFWYHNRRASTGSLSGIAGFLLWAFVFVAAPLQQAYFPAVKLEDEIWNLPKYIVAVSMILLMLEQQVEHNKHLALHDELTGLPNRRLFQDRLATALERAKRLGVPTALLMVDLDNFKEVNDTLGHHTGDLLLQRIAALFLKRIRSSDTVARTGGDEFAVILEPPVNRTDAMLVGRELLALLEQPFELQGNIVHAGASVGIALFPDDAQDMKSLCIQADMRMYQGKRGETILTGFPLLPQQPIPVQEG